MRVAPIGVRFATDPDQLREFTRAASRITHSDPRATVAALSVARLIAWSLNRPRKRRPTAEEFVALLRSCGEDAEWHGIVETLAAAAVSGESVGRVASRLHLSDGVTGYAYHTVPIAAYAWFHHYGDFEAGLSAVLDLGGDTDTVGAIAGGLLGSTTVLSGIPSAWVDGIWDAPRDVALLMELASRLSSSDRHPPVRYSWLMVIPRNALFLLVVLTHGFRRLLQPG